MRKKRVWYIILMFCCVLTGCKKNTAISNNVQENTQDTPFSTLNTSVITDSVPWEEKKSVVEKGIQYDVLKFSDSIQLKREQDKGW